MAKKKRIVVDYNRIEQQVWQLAEPLVAACGAELIDVEYVQEAGNWYLRLYLDREPPVDLDLCERVSNLVSPALDENDPVGGSYFLEVSSPGLERPLRREADYRRFSGQLVCVRLYAPRDGQKEFSGTLLGLRDDGLAILAKDRSELVFSADEVAQCRLQADI